MRSRILAAALACIFAVDLSLFAADSPLKVEINDVPKQHTLVIKTTAKQSEIGATLSKAFPTVYAFAGQHGVIPGAPMAKYTSSGKDQPLQIEAGLIVPVGTSGDSTIIAGDLPAGKVAFAVHVGPYEKLPQTYDAIKAQLAAKGFKDTPVSWEVYMSDPGSTKPEELKTEIYLVIEKIAN